MTPPTLSVAHYIPCTEAEGPGRRFALWLQGCPLRCPGCCNPEYLPFQGGQPYTVAEMLALVLDARDRDNIEGITLLGGEPTSQADVVAILANELQQAGLSVMLFSGYFLEDLQSRHESGIDLLLSHTDILVDGPYDREQPDSERRWIGSCNQRIHFLTERYHYDEQWRRPNTLEIRLTPEGLTVNGFPAPQAPTLWKRPKSLKLTREADRRSDS